MPRFSNSSIVNIVGEIAGASPSLAFTDTTASAKSLTIAVDGNKADFRESAGAASSFLNLDLTNKTLGLDAAAYAKTALYINNSAGLGMVLKAGSASNTRSPLVFQQSDGTIKTVINSVGAYYSVAFLVISGDFSATLGADGSLATFNGGQTGLTAMAEFVADVQYAIVAKAYNSVSPLGTNFVGLDKDLNFTFAIESTGALTWGAGATKASMDLIVLRDAPNTLAQRNGNADQNWVLGGANGVGMQIRSLAELHTLAAAGTSDTTMTAPANSLVVGVCMRVTTTITGCTTLDVGIAGATTRYGTGIALTSGTTSVSPGTTNPSLYSSATKVRFSAIGGGASFTAGVIRVVLYYIDLTAPTS